MKIVRDTQEHVFKVWENNKCIAYTDENGLLFAIINDEPVRLDYADNEREIQQVMEHYGLA